MLSSRTSTRSQLVSQLVSQLQLASQLVSQLASQFVSLLVSQLVRQVVSQLGRQIGRQIDRQVDRSVGRWVDNQRKREKEGERERKRGDLNHLSVHQWLCSAIRDSQQPTSPIGVLFLKLPPPPCAVLLVSFVGSILNFGVVQCYQQISGKIKDQTQKLLESEQYW